MAKKSGVRKRRGSDPRRASQRTPAGRNRSTATRRVANPLPEWFSGGVEQRRGVVARWVQDGDAPAGSGAARCLAEQWYLATAALDAGRPAAPAALEVAFAARGDVQSRRCIELTPLPAIDRAARLVGWFQTPPACSNVRVAPVGGAAGWGELMLRRVGERDPKCHPLAAVPRWSGMRPPFPIERVYLPAGLASLERLLSPLQCEILPPPDTLKHLADRVQGCACVLDPAWIAERRWSLRDIETLAGLAWLVIDLASAARLVNEAGAAETETAELRSAHRLVSARVGYSDVETRGLALQDVAPYSTIDASGAFRMRILRATKSWRAFADREGLATLLSSESGRGGECGHVLSAAAACGAGELIATDLPWLAAGRDGPLVAPAVAEHLLRMHLACPLEDQVQYWNRWDDAQVVLRDITDLEKRHPPLHCVQWSAAPGGPARLGVTLAGPARAGPRRQVVIATGRIDQRDPHDGAPPEALMILMKHLAREVREATPLANELLGGVDLTWQFETVEGLRYVVLYTAAPEWLTGMPDATLRIRMDAAATTGPERGDDGRTATLVLGGGAGVFGDRSMTIQSELWRNVRNWLCVLARML